MKKTSIFLIIIIAIAISSCKDKYIEIFTANSPIYLSYETLRNSVKQTDAKVLENPGKFYFKDNYIFVVEKMKGIHIINNTDPANPKNLTFIEIPGNVDLAIKGTVLYADSYIDMIAIDISDLSNIKEIKRIEKILPYTLPPTVEDYPIAKIDEDKGVVVDWEIKKVRQVVDNNYYPIYKWENNFALSDRTYVNTGGLSNTGIGVGGSMARFSIKDNTLYAVDVAQLHVLNISTPADPKSINDINVGWDIETMFILEDNLFFGTRTGMLIYDISSPTSPRYISTFWHMTSCDPVIVLDTLAYITLRGGNICGNNLNELNVVSIADLENPNLLKIYPMSGPYGLGIDDNVLFICDGDAGLKIYDASDPLAIDDNMLAHFPEIQAFDVIPINGVLILIGEDGIYQYDYQDIENITFISKIEIG
ncbi:MAG: hypothetical protein JEY97_07290 [Bacteroidales bacterium]|nr:hypothetical protein [Bacteroidales bacterium]